MKEIVVISGKGGTGKTSLTAAFAWLEKANLVLADCDVDAADMHLLMSPEVVSSEDFYSGFLAVIDADTCTACGKCHQVCRFTAVFPKHGVFEVDPLSCEGCGYCARVCPVGAITMEEQLVGQCHTAASKTGAPMVHAHLNAGAENSGKLVAKVKRDANSIAQKNGFAYVLVDGSPGVGCPVVSSLSGADLAVVVTEPTASGLHDMRRVLELIQRFSIPAVCIINKADLNQETEEQIRKVLRSEGVEHIASIPYEEAFTQAMLQGKTLSEMGTSDVATLLSQSWTYIKKLADSREANSA
ncbi:MAG: ATP-binding protein [Spirochaetota bacterium]